MFPYNLFEYKWLSEARKGLVEKQEPVTTSSDKRKEHNIESNCVAFDDEHFIDN